MQKYHEVVDKLHAGDIVDYLGVELLEHFDISTIIEYYGEERIRKELDG